MAQLMRNRERGGGREEGLRLKEKQKLLPECHQNPPIQLFALGEYFSFDCLSVLFCLPRGILRVNYRNRPVCFTLIFRQFHFQLLLHKQHATIWGLQRLQGNIDFLTITLKLFDPTFSEGFYKTHILRDNFGLTDFF